MTKVTEKISDLIDPQHKGFKHTVMFRILIGIALLVVLGAIYAVFIVPSDHKAMTDDEREAEAAKEAEYDTIDVVGDYLWPDVKPVDKTEKDDDEKDEETVDHAKSAPQADAATDEDIEEATGQNVETKETPTVEPKPAEKVDIPDIEPMSKPKVENIE